MVAPLAQVVSSRSARASLHCGVPDASRASASTRSEAGMPSMSDTTAPTGASDGTALAVITTCLSMRPSRIGRIAVAKRHEHRRRHHGRPARPPRGDEARRAERRGYSPRSLLPAGTRVAVPIGSRFAPVRIEMPEDVPCNHDICQSHIEVRLIGRGRVPATAVLSEFNALEAAVRASASESVSGTRAFNPDRRSTSTEAPPPAAVRRTVRRLTPVRTARTYAGIADLPEPAPQVG